MRPARTEEPIWWAFVALIDRTGKVESEAPYRVRAVRYGRFDWGEGAGTRARAGRDLGLAADRGHLIHRADGGEIAKLMAEVPIGQAAEVSVPEYPWSWANRPGRRLRG